MKIVVEAVIKREIEVDDKFKELYALADSEKWDEWEELGDELEAIIKKEISNTDNIAYLSGAYEKGNDEPMMEW